MRVFTVAIVIFMVVETAVILSMLYRSDPFEDYEDYQDPTSDYWS